MSAVRSGHGFSSFPFFQGFPFPFPLPFSHFVALNIREKAGTKFEEGAGFCQINLS